LHFLFQKSLKIGKEIRTAVNGCRDMPSIEELILNTSRYILAELAQRSILFVGISEINLKIFNRLKQNNIKKITFCNRTYSRSAELACRENSQILPWENLNKWIVYDLIIFGTKAQDFLIKKEEANEKKIDGPKLVIDLCVPRNVDPRIGRIPGITLFNVDQFKMKSLELARLGSHVIANSIERQMNIFKSREIFKVERLYNCAS
jgi:glutamyl-tRNA reductase